ncbi:MAG: PAS domain-containing protein [Paracoccaceae bacterium]
MKYASLKQVEAYWTALADEAGIPKRAQIDPRGIEDALEYAFILERVAPGVARFRIAGGHLSDLMGMEVRGMPLTAMFEAEERKSVSDLIERVCRTPEMIEITLEAGTGIGRGPLKAKMLLAPLRSDQGTVNRLLGCVQSEGRIGRQPRRFTVSGVKATDLKTNEVYPVASDQPRTLTQLAEPQAAFAHKPKTEKPDDSRPALRLVSSND